VAADQNQYWRGQEAPETRFVLNVAPIHFEADTDVEVGFFPYEDHEQLKFLRSEYGDTHLIRSHKARSENKNSTTTRIVAIPIVEEAPQVGEEFGTIKLSDHLGHAAALIRNSLIDFLVALPRRVFQHHPVTFLAEGSNDNLLAESLPKNVACPDWLAINPLIEAAVRVLEFARQPPFVGMCLNVCTRRRIDRSCQDLMADGFSVMGHYVGTHFVSSDSRIQPRFRLVGRAASVEGHVIRLSDHREDQDAVPANDAYIEAAALDAVLRHVFRENYEAVSRRLNEMLVAFRKGPALLERLQRLRSYFANTPFQMVPGVEWCAGTFFSQEQRGAFPRIERAPSVVYVFDSTGQKTDTWHDRGMDAHGPYSTATFSPTEPRICVICQKAHRGRVEQFVRKFLDGIRLPEQTHGGRTQRRRPKRQPFTKGFVRKYALQDAVTEFFEVDGRSADAYRKAVLRVIQSQTEQDRRYDVALIEIEEDFHRLNGAENPYLVTKAEFLSHQIPVQEFKLETTEIPDHRLQYVLNNMGLATYAKLGGTPWLVRAHLPIAHELVVGLGSAFVGDGKLGERERVVGITTVFSGDGNYCVSTVSKAVSFDDYETELLESLGQTVERVSQSMNWQPKEHIRLVFHSFKPFKSVEENAVKSLVTSLGDYQVDYLDSATSPSRRRAKTLCDLMLVQWLSV